MKQLLSLAALAVAITFTSCGDKSLSGKAASAMCNCPAAKELISLTKEMAKATDEQKMEMMGKIMGISSQLETCVKDVKAESGKLEGAAKDAFKKEFQEKMTKSCPELATAMFDKK
jgi:hypothetical protein